MSNQKKRELAAYKRFINPERDNEYLIAPYIFFQFWPGLSGMLHNLLILLRRNALSRKQQEQIRELRNLCCDAKGYHPSQFSRYRQALYDADPEFANERNFKVLWNDAKDASRKTASKYGSCKAASAESAATSRKNTASAARAASTAAAAGVLGSSCLSSYDDDLDDDDSIALDMEEAIDDAIMFHGGNPFDWDTRSGYLDDPFGFGDDGIGGDGDEW